MKSTPVLFFSNCVQYCYSQKLSILFPVAYVFGDGSLLSLIRLIILSNNFEQLCAFCKCNCRIVE